MSLLYRIMTRRTFLKMNAQLPIFVAGFQTMGVTGVGLLQPPCTGTAYGSGEYGEGCYSGYCVPIGDVYPDVPDGIVDIQDVMAIASRWRMTDEDPDWNSRYDLNGDGIITVVDIMMAVVHWGETCS